MTSEQHPALLSTDSITLPRYILCEGPVYHDVRDSQGLHVILTSIALAVKVSWAATEHFLYGLYRCGASSTHGNTIFEPIMPCLWQVTASAVNRAGIAKLHGVAGLSNATGDDVKKLDV